MVAVSLRPAISVGIFRNYRVRKAHLVGIPVEFATWCIQIDVREKAEVAAKAIGQACARILTDRGIRGSSKTCDAELLGVWVSPTVAVVFGPAVPSASSNQGMRIPCAGGTHNEKRRKAEEFNCCGERGRLFVYVSHYDG